MRRRYSQARQPLKTVRATSTCDLAFGQHALRFGKTRANERRAAVRGDLIDRGAGLELHHFDARLPLECKDVHPGPAGVTTMMVQSFARVQRSELTEAAWPWSARSARPLSSSRTLSVWSAEAETAYRPSGVTATALT